MSKTRLLLLPGMLCDRNLFTHQIENLSEVANVSVENITKHDSIRDTARQVLEEAPESFALAGLSLGGIIAFEVLRQAPERVERLALLDTNPNPPTVQQMESWQKFEDMTRSGRFEEMVVNSMLPTYFHQEDPALEKSAVRMAENVGEEAFLRQLSIQRDRPDSRGDLSGIQCSTLLACGRQDVLCPVEMHEGMASAIPDAKLVVIEACGHLSSMEQPQAVTATLRDWLTR